MSLGNTRRLSGKKESSYKCFYFSYYRAGYFLDSPHRPDWVVTAPHVTPLHERGVETTPASHTEPPRPHFAASAPQCPPCGTGKHAETQKDEVTGPRTQQRSFSVPDDCLPATWHPQGSTGTTALSEGVTSTNP